ncbi:MAG: hypothetical protein V1758_03035 [Pseudomonadota bacterium]
MESNGKETVRERGGLFHAKGITYFRKSTERALFFALTLIMLVWGLIEKFGLCGG